MSKREIRLSVLEMEKLGVTLAFPQYPDTKAEENSRRLAACWNACKGISTETLQQGNIADRVARLEQQRDALLAALEPFGYFRVEPFGWVDCGEKDEGAVALYDQETVNALQGRCDELLKQRDELLEALQLLLEQDDRREDEIWVRNKARAAIRSVEGGAA